MHVNKLWTFIKYQPVDDVSTFGKFQSSRRQLDNFGNCTKFDILHSHARKKIKKEDFSVK